MKQRILAMAQGVLIALVVLSGAIAMPILFRPFYYLYLKLALPLIAWMITGDRKAYDYLAGSIESFPPKEKLSEELRDAGFSDVRALGLTFSIVAVHVATK